MHAQACNTATSYTAAHTWYTCVNTTHISHIPSPYSTYIHHIYTYTLAHMQYICRCHMKFMCIHICPCTSLHHCIPVPAHMHGHILCCAYLKHSHTDNGLGPAAGLLEQNPQSSCMAPQSRKQEETWAGARSEVNAWFRPRQVDRHTGDCRVGTGDLECHWGPRLSLTTATFGHHSAITR